MGLNFLFEILKWTWSLASQTESLAPLELAPGEARAACRLRLRGGATATALRARLTLRTNLTDYTLPLLLYEGTLRIVSTPPPPAARQLAERAR